MCRNIHIMHVHSFHTWAVVTEQMTSPRCALIILPKAVITSPVILRRPLSDKTSEKQKAGYVWVGLNTFSVLLQLKNTYCLWFNSTGPAIWIIHLLSNLETYSKVYLHHNQYQYSTLGTLGTEQWGLWRTAAVENALWSCNGPIEKPFLSTLFVFWHVFIQLWFTCLICTFHIGPTNIKKTKPKWIVKPQNQ